MVYRETESSCRPGDYARIPFESATVSAVVIRACPCGYKREIGKPCGFCGNDNPPVTHDLGVVSATYKSRRRRLWWLAVGQHLANARIRHANKTARGT
jgi:hypothetical protein